MAAPTEYSPITSNRDSSDDEYIGAAKVKAWANNISDMTLWRWLNTPSLNFPKPIYINRRRYWRRSDIRDWLDARHECADAGNPGGHVPRQYPSPAEPVDDHADGCGEWARPPPSQTCNATSFPKPSLDIRTKPVLPSKDEERETSS